MRREGRERRLECQWVWQRCVSLFLLIIACCVHTFIIQTLCKVQHNDKSDISTVHNFNPDFHIHRTSHTNRRSSIQEPTWERCFVLTCLCRALLHLQCVVRHGLFLVTCQEQNRKISPSALGCLHDQQHLVGCFSGTVVATTADFWSLSLWPCWLENPVIINPINVVLEDYSQIRLLLFAVSS